MDPEEKEREGHLNLEAHLEKTGAVAFEEEVQMESKAVVVGFHSGVEAAEEVETQEAERESGAKA